ncbi:MAG TPA: aminomethyl-transferring glycine dehydrogenase subunit GcvPB, partial [Armatimonadota bacterium]|nr:aminomethyl-transferring glycine dehydrogenase subunit GcvPB [Armatimonadota bacterium]
MSDTVPQTTLLEISGRGKRCVRWPALDVPARELDDLIPSAQRRLAPPALPEVSEPEIARHYARLARDTFNIGRGFYPLGSCTMKYNPKVNERIAAMAGWASLHPDTPAAHVQGALKLISELERWLCELGGMEVASLQPPAGASGEFCCVRMFRAYHETRGESQRSRIIVPDSAHGTNPASVTRCGYTSTAITSAGGRVDLGELAKALGEDVSGVMLTNPNTLGLFETDILEIVRMVHDAGALLYYDGANMNAIMGYARPGDMGFDAMHFNLHKTFSTPHGGGGPGSGPVAVKEHLQPFLPVPRATERDGEFGWDWDQPQSIGRVHSYFGNFLVAVRAYAYILTHGAEGLRRVSEAAVLNANYVAEALKDAYDLPHEGPFMHECVLSAQSILKETGVRAMDIAKRLIDHGMHPPTVYFPLIVKEAIMIEPTETEGKATLDQFIAAMREIADEARENP